MTTAITIENLSKKYIIGHQRQEKYTALRDVLMQKVRGIGQRLRHPLSPNREETDLEEFWALKDINLEIKQGERVGIIGRNGAGKSTLLKIISRITEPISGRITIKGRVASLLEVGTGFHPELTGRENIFLNGAILGMSRTEIKVKFDEIVDFAEVEKFLDTPVKRYSSGMYVRLAFAVAAHLEPEILIVDEVLSVGDMQFQNKCLGKIGNIANDGRTVLFVSHNLVTVQQLCSRVLLLENGEIISDNDPAFTINLYKNALTHQNLTNRCYSTNKDLLCNYESEEIKITQITFLSLSKDPLNDFKTGDGLIIRIYYQCSTAFQSPAFRVQIRNSAGVEIIRLNNNPISGYPIKLILGSGHIDLTIDSLPLTAGNYFFTIGIGRERREWVVRLEDVIILKVDEKDIYNSGMPLDSSRGIMVLPHKWVHRPLGTK